MIVTAGKTNVSVYYYIVQDASAASPGEPITGLLFSDIETGGSASYVRQGAARVDLTLVTLASASAVHADGGFILVDDTNMPGVYRCDYPDAAFSTGVDEVSLQIVIAAANNAVVAPIKVQILDVDLRNATSAGLSRLDATVTSRLAPTVAARTLDVTVGGTAGIDWANIEAPTTAVGLSATDIQVAATVTTLTGHTVQTGDSFARIGATGSGLTSLAQAAVLGALADAAAAGDPTSADTLMQYLKQVVNLLAGSTGIGVMPAGVDPANGVNLFEMIRAGLGSGFAQATDSQEQLELNQVTLKSDTDNIQTRLPTTLVSGRMDSDVSNDLRTVTTTLPGQGAPPLTPTIEEMIAWLYKTLRNRKSQTSTLWSLFADDESTVDAKATVFKDGSTVRKEEIVSGP